MITLKKLHKCFKYFFFEIKGTPLFKIKYSVEKTIQYIVTVINSHFSKKIKYPFLINKDYVLENKLGKFFIKKHSDYDYPILPYVEDNHFDEMDIGNKNIFLDIGGHVGTYSIKFINHNRNKNIKIYCFEPHPETYQVLIKNIQINNLQDVIIPINKGVYSKNTTVSFTKTQPKDAAVSKIVEKGSDMDTINIETITIDGFIKENSINGNEIGFIKIDVEGLELEVFKGMENFLKSTNKIKIICEILDEERQLKVFNYLENFGLYKKQIDDFNFLFYK